MTRIGTIAGALIVGVIVSAALAQSTIDTPLIAASTFPTGIEEQNYVPALYYAAQQSETERLMMARDFPYDTCGSCYSPSLYYEMWQLKVAQAY